MRFWATLIALGCLPAVGACTGRSKAWPIAELSTTDREGNSAKIAQLIEQQCFDRADDPVAFDAGLRATGWRFTRRQSAQDADPAMPDLWELPALMVLRRQVVKGAMWNCSVIVKDAISPDVVKMRDALSRAVNQQPGRDGEWWWKPDPAHRAHMTVENGTVENGPPDQSVFIAVEIYRLPWWQRILG